MFFKLSRFAPSRIPQEAPLFCSVHDKQDHVEQDGDAQKPVEERRVQTHGGFLPLIRRRRRRRCLVETPQLEQDPE